jgi:uncharacterized damage-inducible protein DinB
MEMGLIDEAIDMWARYRAGVIAELENVPEEHWDTRPAEGSRTLRELAQHIAEYGVAFSKTLTTDSPNLAWLFDKTHRAALVSEYPHATTKADMIDLLKRTGAEDVQRLRARGEAMSSGRIPFMGNEVSILTALGFASSHEMYHRGQLAVLARTAGCVPALTQQIEAMTKRAAR